MDKVKVNGAAISPIRLGLIDGGFDMTHEDLSFATTIEVYGNTINDHGTHVDGVSTGDLFKYSENGEYNTSVMYLKIAFEELILRDVKVINVSQNNRRD